MLRKKIMKKNFGEFVLAVIGVTVIALLTLYAHAQAIVETNKDVGSPSYGQWVTTSTPIWLNATAENGLNATYYRIWNGTWHPSSDKDYYCGNHNITLLGGPYVEPRYWGYWYIYRSYDSRNPVNFGPIHFHEECMHMIQYFSVDNESYFEEIQNQTHYVDDTPPLVTKEYGEPYYEKTVLLLENFEWSFPPEGWSADAGWSKSDSAHAGGTPPEAHFFSPGWGSYKLRLPVLNTVGYEQLNFSFSYAATFNFNNWLSVWVSPDGSTWYQPWHLDGFGSMPATDVTVTLDSSYGVGSSTFYIEFRASAQAFAGNIFIDDVTVTGDPPKHFITKDTPIYINATDIGNITKLSPGVPMVWPFWEIWTSGGYGISASLKNFGPGMVDIINASYNISDSIIPLSDLTWDNMQLRTWTTEENYYNINKGDIQGLSTLPITDGDVAVLVRYNVSIDGNVVARFIGEVLLQWDGSPAIIGTLTNFDIHNNFSMANNFELEINGIQPENITEFYPGWGTPPNITSWQTWTNITWINTTDPIYYCEWIHFGLGLDEGIDINDISEMIANWTVSCAVGSYQIFYRVWSQEYGWSAWQSGEKNRSVVFKLADLGYSDNCTHYIEYYAIDDLGNNYTEPFNQTVYVDNAEPIINKTIGHPQYLDDGDIFINFSTPIWVNATDNGTEPCIVGSVNLTVGIYNATSKSEIDRYTIYVEDGWAHIGPIYINEECVHWINITAVDDLGNTAYHNETVYVDNTPPEIYKKIIGTNATGGGFKWITSETEFNLSAIDAGCNEGVGLASLQYRIWNGTWTPWMDYAGNFTMDEECIHYLEINATDLLGNSNISNQTYHVDNSPPLSSVNSIHPFCQDLPVLITATAIDLPYCGEVKNVTLYYRYSVHNSSWSPWMKYYTDESSPWAWGFNPTNGSGYYQFYCMATDMLGHVESKSPTVEAWLSVPYNHTFHLIKGWNLITIPVKNHITKASELAALIGNNCTVIVKWDSEKQKYVDYVLGIPPSTNNIDFAIENGMAYFIGMKGNENVSIKGCLFDSLNVLLHSQGYGLNLIGWVNMTEIDSPSIASMAGIDSLWDWNESMQQFIGFPVDIFNVAIGDGIFIHVTSEASWHGGL